MTDETNNTMDPTGDQITPNEDPPRGKLTTALGIRRRPHRWIKFGLTSWGLVLWVTVLGGGGTIAFVEYSMTPGFCKSCHIMQPYYEAWHKSTHSDVPCGDCHFEPGIQKTLQGKWKASSQAVRYATKTYGSKPHAEIQDASCLRDGCHETRLLEGLTEWDVPTQRGDTITIHFDHKPHLTELRRGKQLRCVSCHSQIVQGQHIVVTLDTCFTCHFKGVTVGLDEEVLGGCGSCHSAPQGEIKLATGIFKHQDYLDREVRCENCHSDAVKGDGEVPRQWCWTCHNQPHQLARYGETQFIHQEHVTNHKVECSSCHILIEHHLNAGVSQAASILGHAESMDAPGVCSQCHESTHGGPAQLYQGTGGRGVPDMPSPMYVAQVDCVACHRSLHDDNDTGSNLGRTYLAAQERCDYCHGTRYTEVLDEWRETLSDLLVRADARHTEIDARLRLADVDGPMRLDLRRLLSDAKHNVDYVRLAHGAHNVTYATALLSRAIEFCDEVHRQLPAEEIPEGEETPTNKESPEEPDRP